MGVVRQKQEQEQERTLAHLGLRLSAPRRFAERNLKHLGHWESRK